MTLLSTMIAQSELSLLTGSKGADNYWPFNKLFWWFCKQAVLTQLQADLKHIRTFCPHRIF